MWDLKSEISQDQKFTGKKVKKVTMLSYRCLNSIVGILSQFIQISSHLIVHFKYIIILLINYTPIKLEEKQIYR